MSFFWDCHSILSSIAFSDPALLVTMSPPFCEVTTAPYTTDKAISKGGGKWSHTKKTILENPWNPINYTVHLLIFEREHM